MGAMLVSALEHRDRPSVGLLNIGEEDIKGNEVVKQAAELLKDSGLNFHGNVEGDDIWKGVADVVVCDGFVGNVVAQVVGGLGADDCRRSASEEFSRNPLTKLAALHGHAGDSMPSSVASITARYNGASLLGLKGIVVKSHGSADAYAFRCALEQAAEAARERLPEKIAARMAALHPPSNPFPSPHESSSPAKYSRITGTGSFLPGAPVTNDALIAAHGLESSDDWIVERTGIRSRHLAPDRTSPPAIWRWRRVGGRWPPLAACRTTST